MTRSRALVAANSARDIAETRAVFVAELERKNSGLEAFSYSVSHDLRAPIRRIDSLSQLLLDKHAGNLDADAQECLRFLREAAQRMGELIDDLLLLSKVGRAEFSRARIDLSSIAQVVAEELKKNDPDRQVTLRIQDHLLARLSQHSAEKW